MNKLELLTMVYIDDHSPDAFQIKMLYHNLKQYKRQPKE